MCPSKHCLAPLLVTEACFCAWSALECCSTSLEEERLDELALLTFSCWVRLCAAFASCAAASRTALASDNTTILSCRQPLVGDIPFSKITLACMRSAKIWAIATGAPVTGGAACAGRQFLHLAAARAWSSFSCLLSRLQSAGSRTAHQSNQKGSAATNLEGLARVHTSISFLCSSVSFSNSEACNLVLSTLQSLSSCEEHILGNLLMPSSNAPVCITNLQAQGF